MIKFLSALFTLLSQCLGIVQVRKDEKKQEAYNEQVEKIKADPVDAFMAEFAGDARVSKPEPDTEVQQAGVLSSQTKVKPRSLKSKRRFKRQNQPRKSKSKRPK